MTNLFVAQEQFANRLINYVKERGVTTLGKHGEEPIGDHWVANNEEHAFSGCSCLVHHGLFDTIFRREPIIPRNWYSFQRQYLSSLADLLNRLYQECQHPGSHSWGGTGNQVRNDFHMNQDFWTNKTQEENYQHYLRNLEARNLLRRKAMRRYRDDRQAVSVLINGEWTDIPGSYRMLEFAIQDMGGIKNSADTVRVSVPYGERVPVMFLVGSTIARDPNCADDKVYQIVEQHTTPTPKLQEIIYVLAERKDGLYTTRHIGRMVAYMLEFVYGSPTGHIKYDMIYYVPQPDLSENERKSLNCSMTNWKMHHPSILENHPSLKNHILEGK